MDQTNILDITYKQRLDQYSDILSKNVTPDKVFKEWTEYLLSSVDCMGWQAIWKIPRDTCETFNISFPTEALVFVEELDFTTLVVSVRIISVQNGIKLPNSATTYLYYLWPTEEQDESAFLSINETTAPLDNLRFFHKYLWRPWDEECNDEESCEKWFEKHLIPRLKLYYELKHGVISKKLRDQYRLLLIETKEKYKKFKQLQEEDDTNYETSDIPDKLRDLFKMQKTLDLFEDPNIRGKVFVKNNKNNKKNTSNLWLVIQSDLEFDDYFEFIENVKAFSNSSAEFKAVETLQDALEKASPNDIIFIGSGKHVVTSSGNFLEGGKIVNVNYPKEAIITTTNEYLLFYFNKGEIILQNLKFELNNTQYGLKVRNNALLIMENCVIEGSPDFISTQQGIISENAEIHLKNCELYNLGDALYLNNTTITIDNSKIHTVRCGIRTHQSTKITLNFCELYNCSYSIMQIEVETDSTITENKLIGGLNILESLPNIKLLNTNADSSTVIITKKIQFVPMKDILSNPKYNTSLLKQSTYYF